MDRQTTWNPSEFDRRRFIQLTGLGATGALTGLAGCTGGSDDGDDGTGGDGNAGGDGSDDDGATGGPVEGGRLVWGHSEVTQNLDIHQTGTASTLRFLNSVYESLVGLTNELELSTEPDIQQPGLAQDWDVSSDQLSYTFYLREGVMFHDGTELTADDVQYSFERIADPDTAAIQAHVFQSTDSIETDGDYTVVVNQSEVYQPFLRQLAVGTTAIIPAGSGDSIGDEPVGTGPFMFNSRQQGNQAELEAFSDYWGEGPYLDFVEEHTVTDPDTRLTSVESGQFDFINDIPLDNINSLSDNQNDDLAVRQWTPLSWAFLNMNNVEAPFDDRDFRVAVDYLIDKESLVEGALFGNGRTTASPSFPSSPFRNDDLEPRPNDPDLAEEHFEMSAYDPGDYELTFKVTTNYPWHVEAATIMQQFFQQGGLEVQIERLQWSDWLDQVWINRDFELAMVNFFTFWEPDYMYTALWTSDGSFNFRGYSSEDYDSTIDDASSAGSRDEAIELYQEAQQILYDDTPDVMLWFRDGTLAAQNYVGGLDTVLSPNNSDLNFRNVWLDE